jgi:iron only hydrogenase large subunit-like protein
MACPAGCLNGGGQPKPGAGQSARDALEAAQAAYGAEAGVAERQPGAHPLVAQVYASLGGGPGSAPARAALHTTFHVREATVTAQLSNW